jgi:hypothetical protein
MFYIKCLEGECWTYGFIEDERVVTPPAIPSAPARTLSAGGSVSIHRRPSASEPGLTLVHLSKVTTPKCNTVISLAS